MASKKTAKKHTKKLPLKKSAMDKIMRAIVVDVSSDGAQVMEIADNACGPEARSLHKLDLDDIAARTEAIFEAAANGGWMSYETRLRHDGFPPGARCFIRFCIQINKKPCVEVDFVNVSRNGQRRWRPKRHYWYYPGLEDTEEARRLYECQNRHYPMMRPY